MAIPMPMPPTILSIVAPIATPRATPTAMPVAIVISPTWVRRRRDANAPRPANVNAARSAAAVAACRGPAAKAPRTTSSGARAGSVGGAALMRSQPVVNVSVPVALNWNEHSAGSVVTTTGDGRESRFQLRIGEVGKALEEREVGDSGKRETP